MQYNSVSQSKYFKFTEFKYNRSYETVKKALKLLKFGNTLYFFDRAKKSKNIMNLVRQPEIV